MSELCNVLGAAYVAVDRYIMLVNINVFLIFAALASYAK